MKLLGQVNREQGKRAVVGQAFKYFREIRDPERALKSRADFTNAIAGAHAETIVKIFASCASSFIHSASFINSAIFITADCSGTAAAKAQVFAVDALRHFASADRRASCRER